MNTWQLRVGDEPGMEMLGARLGRALDQGGVVYLDGTLGAGKTTLARGLIRGAGHPGVVKSPTYTLVEPYPFPDHPVYHFDLYRLQDPEELELMGVRDYFTPEALVLVEWPERGGGLLPAPDLHLTITVVPEGRDLTLTALTNRGQAALARLSA